MAFFNNDAFTSVAGVPTIEGLQYDVDFNGANNIIRESYEDQLEVVRAIHAADIAELGCIHEGYDEGSSRYEQVMEGVVGDIFEKIKDGLKKFFGKIGAFFKSIYEKFILANKSNKAFSSKYVSILNSLDEYIRSVSVEGFDYKPVKEIVETADKGAEAAKDYVDKVRERTEKVISSMDSAKDGETYSSTDSYLQPLENMHMRDAFRAVVGGSMPKDASPADISALIRTTLRKGTPNSAETLTKSTITYSKDEIVKNIEELANIDIKKFKKCEATTTKDFNKILGTVESAKKRYLAMSSESKAKAGIVRCVNNLYKNVTSTKGVVISIIGAIRNALSDLSRQIRTATLKAVEKAREVKKSSKNKNK